ncbi:MAG TPA: hypothetical protein VKS21_05055 [Spirochaetota bacterium]|nr:hypothetical protein [Spirochaetota bacterium]
MKNNSFYKSELSKKRKKKVLTGIFLLLLSLFFLYTIGESANENPYNIRSFLAGLLAIVAVVYIPYSLYRNK